MNDRLEKASNGVYNNLLFVVLAVAAVYVLVRGFGKSKQQTYLDTAGTDRTTQQAQALRDAMNRSGIKIMMSVDGTDVDLIMQTAAQIKDYPAVSDAYRVLYPGSELTTDLQEELSRTDLLRFWDIVYKRNVPTTPTTGTGGTAGKRVQARQTVNVRDYDKPNVIVRTAKTGEIIGPFAGEATLTVTGPKDRFVIVEIPGFLNLYTTKYYVHKASVALI